MNCVIATFIIMPDQCIYQQIVTYSMVVHKWSPHHLWSKFGKYFLVLNDIDCLSISSYSFWFYVYITGYKWMVERILSLASIYLVRLELISAMLKSPPCSLLNNCLNFPTYRVRRFDYGG